MRGAYLHRDDASLDVLDMANALRRIASKLDTGMTTQSRTERDDCRVLIAAAAILEGSPGACSAALAVLQRRKAAARELSTIEFADLVAPPKPAIAVVEDEGLF